LPSGARPALQRSLLHGLPVFDLLTLLYRRLARCMQTGG
jgi:hypothetical protein